jgi:hypothetical protein
VIYKEALVLGGYISRLLSRKVKMKIYTTTIFPVVFYQCETCSLTLREEHSLRVFENRMLRIICGLEMDEITGYWRKFHNKELPNVHSSPNIIRMNKSRRMRCIGHVTRMGRKGTRSAFWRENQKERDH